VENTRCTDDLHFARVVMRDDSFSSLIGCSDEVDVGVLFSASIGDVSNAFSPAIPAALAKRVGESGLGRLSSRRRFILSHDANPQPALGCLPAVL